MIKKSLQDLRELSRLIRYWILESTTQAGSGHLTSSLSAVEIMVTLMFGGFLRYDIDDPSNPNNDRLIFSKGHAAPLLYALFAAAGSLKPEALLSLRKFASPLEGHPTPEFPHVEVATGSLGQGLSVGLGMAINGKYLDHLPYRTFVLLGDSEMSEGSVWEAVQLADYYRLNNLIGIIDVNRLGQRGETMYGHNLKSYIECLNAFGWHVLSVAGHDHEKLIDAFSKAIINRQKPLMIVAKTIKGKGVSFLEDKPNWHGKTLSRHQFKKAVEELGKPNLKIRGVIKKPLNKKPVSWKTKPDKQNDLPTFKLVQFFATRKAYGIALAKLGYENPLIVSLDAEVKNSTFADIFEKHHPERFFEMFLTEQNMVSVALGLSKRGKIPFVSTFAAFFTRAFDQIRMASYSKANIKLVGSNVGVSIGQDGPSQMGLEDIAMFRSVHGSVILYPSDAISTEKLLYEAAKLKGMVYIRITRRETPVIYDSQEIFPIGGCKVVRQSNHDKLTIIAAGITLHETLKAYEILKKEAILVRVIDLYSIKPLAKQVLEKASRETKAILTVEDHHPEGGIGEAVRSALSQINVKITCLAVSKWERSGESDELLDYEDIAAKDIVSRVKNILKHI